MNPMGWMPHGHCYAWEPRIYYPWVFFDSAIAFGYMVAFMIIIIASMESVGIPWYRVTLIVLLGLFVFFCGIDHAVGVWQIHEPVYQLVVIVKGLTFLATYAYIGWGWWFVVRPWLRKKWEDRRARRAAADT